MFEKIEKAIAEIQQPRSRFQLERQRCSITKSA
jgi:hypothetical protein